MVSTHLPLSQYLKDGLDVYNQSVKQIVVDNMMPVEEIWPIGISLKPIERIFAFLRLQIERRSFSKRLFQITIPKSNLIWIL